ncbi:uncharacterized protein LOC143039017 [Oratosquilla oratoria]|uniref:uncharacterized protein LOC143039017 n=1 Tax=Oratosquilla oratoria TaxID=337810 RepID=UPI003F776596
MDTVLGVHSVTPYFSLGLIRKVTLVVDSHTQPNPGTPPIEGEALAVADALEKSRYFALGCDNLTIVVDHKPLLKILSDHSLDDIPSARLRNLKENTCYRFKIVHMSGVKHCAADVLSRHLTSDAEEMVLQDDMAVIRNQGFLPDNLCSILTSMRSSDDQQFDMIIICKPLDNDSSPLAHKPLRLYLYTVGNVIIYRDQIVIPQTLREPVLTALHSVYQGVSSMISQAESSVFWLGITQDIVNLRKAMQPLQQNSTITTICSTCYPHHASIPIPNYLH